MTVKGLMGNVQTKQVFFFLCVCVCVCMQCLSAGRISVLGSVLYHFILLDLYVTGSGKREKFAQNTS